MTTPLSEYLLEYFRITRGKKQIFQCRAWSRGVVLPHKLYQLVGQNHPLVQKTCLYLFGHIAWAVHVSQADLLENALPVKLLYTSSDRPIWQPRGTSNNPFAQCFPILSTTGRVIKTGSRFLIFFHFDIVKISTNITSFISCNVDENGQQPVRCFG